MKKKILTMSFLFICIFMMIPNVNAATTLYSYSFEGSAATFGGVYRKLDHFQGISLDYVKVVIDTTGGDEYDVRLMYTTDFPSNARKLAEKTKLTAKGTKSTIYFIPQDGSCPVSNTNNCIKVPVISGVSTSAHAVSNGDVMYGIEIHNRSWLGGTLNFSVSYSFINY